MNRRFQRNAYPIHKKFCDVYPDAAGHTMLDWYRLRVLYELAIATEALLGDIAEAGVWRGGASYMLADMGRKTVHAFDSWEGLPRGTKEDEVEPGFVGRSLDDLVGLFKCPVPQEYLSKLGDKIQIHAGWFVDTFPMVDVAYSLVHVDCDLYEAAKLCLEYFYPRLASGGFMVFDDYYVAPEQGWGVATAVDQFFEGQKVQHWTWGSLVIRKE